MKRISLIFLFFTLFSCKDNTKFFFNGEQLNSKSEAFRRNEVLASVSNEISDLYGESCINILIGQSNSSIIQILKIDFSKDSVFSTLIYYLPNRDVIFPKIFKIDTSNLEKSKGLLEQIEQIKAGAKKPHNFSPSRNMGGSFFRIEVLDKDFFSRSIWIINGNLSDNKQLFEYLKSLFQYLHFKPIFSFNELDFQHLVNSHLPERLDSINASFKSRLNE